METPAGQLYLIVLERANLLQVCYVNSKRWVVLQGGGKQQGECFPWHLGTYHAQASQGTEQEKMDYALNNKRRVVRLVLQWAALYGEILPEDEAAMAFLEVGHICCCCSFFRMNINGSWAKREVSELLFTLQNFSLSKIINCKWPFLPFFIFVADNFVITGCNFRERAAHFLNHVNILTQNMFDYNYYGDDENRNLDINLPNIVN